MVGSSITEGLEECWRVTATSVPNRTKHAVLGRAPLFAVSRHLTSAGATALGGHLLPHAVWSVRVHVLVPLRLLFSCVREPLGLPQAISLC